MRLSNKWLITCVAAGIALTVATADAATFRGDGDGEWFGANPNTTSGTNWDGTVSGFPTSSDDAFIFGPDTATILNGETGLSSNLNLGTGGFWAGGNVVVESGGALTVSGNANLGLGGSGGHVTTINNSGTITFQTNAFMAPGVEVDGVGSTATFSNSGDIDAAASFHMSFAGVALNSTSTFTMTGGTFDIADNLVIGDNTAGSDTTTQLNMHGGTITASGLFYYEPEAGNEIDVRGDGKLILAGDFESILDGYIADGIITGDAGLDAFYDANLNQTTLAVVRLSFTLAGDFSIVNNGGSSPWAYGTEDGGDPFVFYPLTTNTRTANDLWGTDFSSGPSMWSDGSGYWGIGKNTSGAAQASTSGMSWNPDEVLLRPKATNPFPGRLVIAWTAPSFDTSSKVVNVTYSFEQAISGIGQVGLNIIHRKSMRDSNLLSFSSTTAGGPISGTLTGLAVMPGDQLFFRIDSWGSDVEEDITKASIDIEIVPGILSKEQASSVGLDLWQDMAQTDDAESREEELANRIVRAADKEMKYLERTFGAANAGERSLWISLHGGGQTTTEVNDQQWQNQIELYEPEEGIVVAPRAPTDTWNMWHQPHIDALLDRLIENFILAGGVDPNRVYLLGYSAGGDGVYQLAPRMADRFAAASMMAGHPNDASPLGLRNLPFRIFMGSEDTAFGRIEAARDWETRLAALRDADPGGYPHEVTIYEGLGHWMDGRDAEGIPWMAGFTRNPLPSKIVWNRHKKIHDRFYWLHVPVEAVGDSSVVRASINGQQINLEIDGDLSDINLRLNDQLLDLEQPLSVHVNGVPVFYGKVPRTIGAIRQSLLQRLDPQSIASAELSIALTGAGNAFAVERQQMMDDGSFLIEFSTTAGRTYEVQYSSDMIEWNTATTIVAPSNRALWYDYGPPNTESLPLDVDSRFYRIVELP